MTSTISEPMTGARLAPSASLVSGLAPSRRRVPVPAVPLLHRLRLTNLMQNAITSRVTVVRGPSGSGKTVACAMWATAACDSDSVAWVDLDPADRDPAKFAQSVSDALTASLAADVIAPELADLADGSFALRLAAAAEHLTRPVVLAFDDVQQLAGSAALDQLELLVKHGPPTLRLLLIGRHLTGLSVARLQVGGELAEIRPAELACTAAEAADYFAMLDVDLPADQLDELLSRTHGWITGLRLAALRPAPPWLISGDDPLVADYLRDEVLAPLSAERREFLLMTCLADQICGDLADELTGGQEGTTVLEQLCRENILVQAIPSTATAAQPAGPASSGYQYHPLLLELLRSQLRRELPADFCALARRAAGWQAAHGRPAEALRNAVQAADWELAATVLAQAGPQLLLPGPAAKLEPVLAALPAEKYASDAAVAAALAAAGVRTGDRCATQLHLDNARAALDDCPAERRNLVDTWLLALRLMHDTAIGRADADLIAAATKTASRAVLGARRLADHQAVGLLWTALGVAALGGLRLADARDALAQAERELHGSDMQFRARATGWRAIAEAMYGDLVTAGELVASARVPTGAGDEPPPRMLTDLAAAYLHLAKDETAPARRLLETCEHADPGHDYGAQVARSLTMVARARLALCDGDQAAARRLISRLRYQCLSPASSRSRPSYGALPTDLDAALASLDADVALGEGNAAGARQALARAEEAEPRRADLLLGTAKVLLAEGDPAAALASAESCLTGTEITLRDQISALVTAAVARRRLGQAEQATDQLGHALALAEPHGMYRPFIDGGSAARSALTVLIRPTSTGAAVAARILQRFDTRPVKQAELPAAVPLTGSELAVLRFLPSHMTNQEIAESLFLSINTVKTHLRSVYRKLGVTTRRQAITAAGRLGLL